MTFRLDQFTAWEGIRQLWRTGCRSVRNHYGQRFGPGKRFGLLVGGTYDWNGRGINDLEPSPTVSSLSPHYDSIDLRDYKYYRTRWGFTGNRLQDQRRIECFCARALLQFKDFGQKWVYTLNDGDVPKSSIDWRRPNYGIASVSAGGHQCLHLRG